MKISRKYSAVTTACSLTLLGALAATWFSSGVDAQEATAPEKKAARNAEEQEEEKKTLADFMSMKMDASGLILEGLLLDNPKLILRGAKKLDTMRKAEKWRVSNDMMYRHHSKEFQDNIDKLMEAAEGDSLDRTALVWFNVTLSCIDCHRWVRTVLIADAPEGTGLRPAARSGR